MNKGYENLLESIEKDAMAEKEKIIKSAEEQILKIRSDAEVQARNLKEERLNQTEKQLQLERARRLGKVEIELRNDILRTKHDIIQQVLGNVEAEIDGIRKKKTVYDRVFQSMLKQTVEEFDGSIVVKVHADDKARCEGILNDRKKPSSIETSKDICGGIEISSEDGRFTVRNNFASRLNKVRAEVVGSIARTLFT